MDDNGSTMHPGAPAPTGSPPAGDPPGIRAQVGATIEAGKRLLNAHVELARTELGEIASSVGRMVGLFALAGGVMLVASFLLLVGGVLWLGDWLFGSIGWGVLLGFLLLLDVALMAALAALDVSGKRLASSAGLALVVGVAVGIVMALDVTHRGWTALADAVAPNSDPNSRAVLLSAGVSAAVLGGLAVATGFRSSWKAALSRLAGGVILGALLGVITVVSIPSTVGAAFGVLIFLITWPALAGRDVLRTGIDSEALKKKFTPEATIGLTKETIEWVRARTPLVPKS